MGVQASREPRCQNVSCSSKWTFRDVNCAVMDGNAAEICAQSVIDCNKESCSAIAAPGKVGSELERVRQDMKTWFFSQMEIIPADSKLLSAVSGLVHAGNAAWECNMSGAQYALKAAFDNVVKIPVVLSCLRKLHSYATKDAGSIQQRLKKAEETTKAYIQVFSELIRQHQDVHDCYEMYRKQECKRPSKSLNNYYKNGVKRIVEHAHSVYVQFMQRTVDVEVDVHGNISVWETDWPLNRDTKDGNQTLEYANFPAVQSVFQYRLKRMRSRAGMATPASWGEKAASFVSYQLFSRGLLSLCIRLVTAVASVSTAGATDLGAALSCFVATYLSIAAAMIVREQATDA